MNFFNLVLLQNVKSKKLSNFLEIFRIMFEFKIILNINYNN